jgi:hypothetical protein
MSQAKIWFVLSEGQTTGPFEPDEVEKQLGSLKEPQVWGRGHSEWMNPTRWRQVLREAGHALPKTPAVDPSQPQGLWRVRVHGQEKQPLRYGELITYLKGFPDLSAVDVYPETGDAWKEVYGIPRLVEELGISRRSHPRVPIVGTLTYELPQAEAACRVISISEGGIGINDAHGLQIGSQFQATLTSPNLYVTITSMFEVVYVGADGYAGLRFIDLPDEFKSSVIEYVNKFAVHQ